MAASQTALPRTLTQMLRERDDAALVTLMLARPDLADPAPAGFAELASRATTRHSVSAALDKLNAFELWVAARVARLHGVDVEALYDDRVDSSAVTAAVERLVALGLIWGGVHDLRPVRALAATLPEPTPDDAPPSSEPPELPEAGRANPEKVAKVAAGSAFELVRRIDVLVEHCDHQPVRLLRTGGLANRDVRAVGDLIDVRPTVAQSHLELARAAGLIGLGADDRNDLLLPTTEFDSWQSRALATQWVALVSTWFDHHPNSGKGWVKRLALSAFGDPADGRTLSALEVTAWLDWKRPRRPGRSHQQVTTMLEQASWLGLTGLDAVASYTASLDAEALADLLPQRVDHVVIQADFTAIAPGPLTAEAAHDLGTLADVESRGGATVYRFSVASLERARRLGWSSDEMLATLAARSRTPLPQPLRYLVSDLERRDQAPGYQPSGASAGPATSAAAAHAHRAPQRGVIEPPDGDADQLDAGGVLEIVTAFRAGDKTAAADRADAQSKASNEAVFETPLTTLREAVETQEVVWCGYVDASGERTERLVTVSSVEDGQVEAHDTKGGEPLTLPLRRITAAHILRSRA